MLRITLTLLLALAPSFAFAANKLMIDTGMSDVKWTGTKALIKGSHTGTVQYDPASWVSAEGDKIMGGEIIVNLGTLGNSDLTDPEMKAKLVNHLRSDDFFAADKYKTAKFVVTKSTPEKDGMQKITGKLTIRDVTRDESFMAKINRDGAVLVADGKMELDRTKFNIKYNSKDFFPDLVKSAKDKVIDNKFTLDFHIQTKPK